MGSGTGAARSAHVHFLQEDLREERKTHTHTEQKKIEKSRENNKELIRPEKKRKNKLFFFFFIFFLFSWAGIFFFSRVCVPAANTAAVTDPATTINRKPLPPIH